MSNGNQPAFPTKVRQLVGIVKGESAFELVESPGLTKREWLAGMALQGLCANPADGIGNAKSADLALWAIECADALLSAQEGKQT